MNRTKLRITILATLVSLVLLAPIATQSIAAQSARRAIANLLGQTDADGDLLVTSSAGVAQAPFSARRAIGNLLGRTDATGNLMVAMDGAQTVESIEVTQGEITAQEEAISTTATLNNAAVTFTHWLANVTDTASAAASKLLDLQKNGVSMFNVDKNGNGTFAGTEVALGATGNLYYTGRNRIYSPSNGATRLTNAAASNTFELTLSDWGTTLSCEANAVANAGLGYLGDGKLGYLFSSSTEDGRNAQYSINGTINSTNEISDPGGIFSATKDTASSINIYYDAAGASGAGYYIQNLRGSSRSIRACLIGS